MSSGLSGTRITGVAVWLSMRSSASSVSHIALRSGVVPVSMISQMRFRLLNAATDFGSSATCASGSPWTRKTAAAAAPVSIQMT